MSDSLRGSSDTLVGRVSRLRRARPSHVFWIRVFPAPGLPVLRLRPDLKSQEHRGRSAQV